MFKLYRVTRIMVLSKITVVYVVFGCLETFVFLLIAIQTFWTPKKVRYVLLIFSLLTLPASIVNILTKIEIAPIQWNSLAYLVSTYAMLALHFWLNLDTGRQLRVGGIEYKSPTIIAGTIALVASLICLIFQICYIFVKKELYPFKTVFIISVCCAIVGDGAVYMYSFSALINFKTQRVYEGQTNTTFVGVSLF